MNAATYPYATGDLIEKPNTYFYTPYVGSAFFEAWRTARDQSLADLPAPAAPPPALPADVESRRAADLLEHAIAGDASLQESFLAKFEVTKRVHREYGKDFRATDASQRYDLPLYVRAADLFEGMYANSGSLRALNVLAKCLDTLCSVRSALATEHASRLAWHILAERQHVGALAQRLGVAL